jgi:hypothetical protein
MVDQTEIRTRNVPNMKKEERAQQFECNVR